MAEIQDKNDHGLRGEVRRGKITYFRLPWHIL